jgi:hypothetical protein
MQDFGSDIKIFNPLFEQKTLLRRDHTPSMMPKCLESKEI